MHPLTKILALLSLAILLQSTHLQILCALAVVLGLLLVCYRSTNYLRMLRRMRWLFISLLLIFAFNTPGEYVHGWPFELAPSYEGIREGLLQAARIALMLAGVALLLRSSEPEQLIAGFYLLLSPLKLFGLAPERFAARLWLTLHYVEQNRGKPAAGNFLDRFRLAETENADDEQALTHVELDSGRFGWCDLIVSAALLLAVLVNCLL